MMCVTIDGIDREGAADAHPAVRMRECRPGDVALFAHAFGSKDSGAETVTLDGVTYTEVASGVEFLFGSGIATTRWIPNISPVEPGPVWFLASVRYDFSQTDPVPEPGTMALVGMGGVAALLRRRKQRA